jgi:hypothetical protein
LLQLAYIFIAIGLVLLGLGLFSWATGKSSLPTAISRRLRRVPASPADQRRQGLAVAMGSVAVLLYAVVVLLDEAGQSRGSIHSLAFALAVAGLAVSMLFVLRVRSVDRKDGSVSTGWEQVRKAFGR